MTGEELRGLERGDVIRHKLNPGKSFVVTANYGDRVTAVETVDITNPTEWELVLKSNYTTPKEGTKETDSRPKMKWQIVKIINSQGLIHDHGIQLPEEWHMCDGTRGTPDLRDTDPRWPKYNEEDK